MKISLYVSLSYHQTGLWLKFRALTVEVPVLINATIILTPASQSKPVRYSSRTVIGASTSIISFVIRARAPLVCSLVLSMNFSRSVRRLTRFRAKRNKTSSSSSTSLGKAFKVSSYSLPSVIYNAVQSKSSLITFDDVFI